MGIMDEGKQHFSRKKMASRWRELECGQQRMSLWSTRGCILDASWEIELQIRFLLPSSSSSTRLLALFYYIDNSSVWNSAAIYMTHKKLFVYFQMPNMNMYIGKYFGWHAFLWKCAKDPFPTVGLHTKFYSNGTTVTKIVSLFGISFFRTLSSMGFSNLERLI